MRRNHAPFVLASLALILQAGSAAAAGGSAQFNPNINWQYSSNLYYNVNGGPADISGRPSSTTTTTWARGPRSHPLPSTSPDPCGAAPAPTRGRSPHCGASMRARTCR